MKIRFSAILPIIFSMWASQAVAAPAVDINGECPEEFSKYLSENDELAYSVIENLPLFRTHDGDTLVKIPANVTVGMRKQLNQSFIESDRILVGIAKPKEGYVCGWAPRRFVLEEGFRPLKVTEVSPDSPNNVQMLEIKDKVVEVENPLFLKALLRSNAATDNEGTNAKRVTLYDSPAGNRKVIADVGIFSLFYVYKIHTTNNGRWFFVAGISPTDTKTTAGWIPEDSMFAWETQVSLYFNRQTTGTDIYSTRIGLAKKNDTLVMAGHPRTKQIEPEDSNIARFPILTHFNLPYEDEDIGQRETRYQIGFFGESCDEITGVCKSAKESLEEMSENVRAGNQFRHVDILYLLDNSKSMSPYFDAVVSGVREATSQMDLSDDSDVKVRFAAATYGDFLTKANPPLIDDLEFSVVADFADYGQTRHLAKLTDLAKSNTFFKDSAYKDLPEAGSAALIKAVDSLNWSETAGTKLIVWIGDHGDRQDESLKSSLSEAAKLFHKSSLMINAINVAGNFNATHNANFISQANVVNSQLIDLSTKNQNSDDANALFNARKNQEPVRLAYDTGQTATTSESVAATKKLVIENVAEINQEALALAKILKDAFEGRLANEADIKKAFPKARLGQLALALSQAGYDEETIKRISREEQLMTGGWVSYREEIENFDFWINVSSDHMDDFQKVISSACEAFQTGKIEGPLEDAMINLARNLSGDRYDAISSEETIAEVLVKYLFIPKEYFGSYLDYSPSDIVELWREVRASGKHELRKELYKPVCESAYLLDLVNRDQRVDDPDRDLIPDELGYHFSVEDDKIRDFNWVWGSSSGVEFYYIPASYLPGRIKRYREIQ